MSTVGFDLKSKIIKVASENIKIQVWDTAGQERYKALTQGFFRNAHGILIVYDVTNAETFDNLKYWVQSIHTHLGEKGNVKVIIIGNKIDLSREIKKEDAEKFAEENNYKYFETSALSGEGIDESITYLGKQVLENKTKTQTTTSSDGITIQKSDVKKDDKKCGC